MHETVICSHYVQLCTKLATACVYVSLFGTTIILDMKGANEVN